MFFYNFYKKIGKLYLKTKKICRFKNHSTLVSCAENFETKCHTVQWIGKVRTQPYMERDPQSFTSTTNGKNLKRMD